MTSLCPFVPAPPGHQLAVRFWERLRCKPNYVLCFLTFLFLFHLC